MSNGTPTDNNNLIKVLSNTVSAQEFINNNGFNIQYQNISKARIKGIKVSNFSISDSYLSNFDARNSSWKNGTFKKVEFDQVYFDKSSFENVIFENCKINNTNFIESQLKNVKFINCEIIKSALNYLIDSSIEFKGSRIINNEDDFSDSQVKLRFIDSVISSTNFDYLKNGSSILIENSEISDSNFIESKLDYFKIIGSKISKSSFADSEITTITVQNSNISFSLHDAKVEHASIDNSIITGLSVMKTIGKTFSITNCKRAEKISLFNAQINNISIKDCDFDSLHPSYAISNFFSIENSTIADLDFTAANIENLTMKNVTFTEKAEFTDFNPENATLENVKKGPNLELITDGSTIKF